MSAVLVLEGRNSRKRLEKIATKIEGKECTKVSVN